MFKCKQFTVKQGNCAMKVNTDSLILGSWADVTDGARVLDIGTGTGVLALMMAQKTDTSAHINAIDIDTGAVEQAKENVHASPWPHKVTVFHCDISKHISNGYDAIITNPPYFAEQNKRSAAYDTQSHTRKQARQFLSLSPEALFNAVAKNLSSTGRCYCLYPAVQENETRRIALAYGLHVQRILRVKHEATVAPYVNAYCFASTSAIETEETLIIRAEDGRYSAQYQQLCRAFYLNF
jgi:tRNA1Val (adenine37-N6)-methyltransferase